MNKTVGPAHMSFPFEQQMQSFQGTRLQSITYLKDSKATS